MLRYCPKCKSKLRKKCVDDEQRLACGSDTCSFVFWNNPVPVVAALVRYKDKYILARNARWPEGIFSVITGYLEAKEVPEQAVLREVEEELGLQGEIQQYIGHYMFAEKNQLLLCFEIVATGELQFNEELAEVRLLSPEKLLHYDFGPLYITRAIIADWAKSSSLTG